MDNTTQQRNKTLKHPAVAAIDYVENHNNDLVGHLDVLRKSYPPVIHHLSTMKKLIDTSIRSSI